MAQRDTNPYEYSDSNKRYMTYDWYLKERYGGKVAKVLQLEHRLDLPES